MPIESSQRVELLARGEELRLLLLERPYSKTELARHFGVSKRTIKRHIDALPSHYGIVEEQQGKEIVYWMEGFENPKFSPTELAILVLAQESVAATARTLGPPYDRSLESLVRKVTGSLPSGVRKKYQVLAEIFGSSMVPAKNFHNFGQIVENLSIAAAEQRRVKMEYVSFSTNDSISLRKFDPYAVYFDPDGGVLKTLGFDHKRNGIIPFSIDHIRSLELLKEPFTRPSNFNLRAFLEANCFNGFHGEPIRVVLRAFGKTAQVFGERKFHPSQQTIESLIQENGEDSITIEMCVAQGRGLVRFILSWMPEIEVLAPEKVRAEVAKNLREGLERHIT